MAKRKEKIFYQKDLSQVKLVKLPCKDFADIDNLPSFIERLLNKGICNFPCTICSYELPWQTIRHLLRPTEHKLTEWESKLKQNSEKRNKLLKQCPRCRHLLQREDEEKLCVKCPECRGASRRDYTFCWDCLREWKESPDRSSCSSDCSSLMLLRFCCTINVPGSAVHQCPTVRACPQCSHLLSHSGGCNYMVCPHCVCTFCYRCLESNSFHGSSCPIKPNP